MNVRRLFTAGSAFLGLMACNPYDSSLPAPEERVLALAAYSAPREVYLDAILPGFISHRDERSEKIGFQTSFQASGAQAAALVGGFDADVVALAHENDLERLVERGLITHPWREDGVNGFVARSVIVIAVRPGNPKAIRTWEDLARPGLAVLMPDPGRSGGARWNLAAIYGSALRAATSKDDLAAAEDLVYRVLGNVATLDRDARESMLAFENGVGDAAVTYESEAIVARRLGRAVDYVIPPSTLQVETPAAWVDHSVTEHGNRDLAMSFVDFLVSPEAQQHYADYGLRPVLEGIHPASGPFQVVPDLFTMNDLGGWTTMNARLFDAGGLVERSLARIAKERGGAG